MHIEFLVEDQSGKMMLDMLTPRIIGDAHTFKVHAYKGAGHIPKNLNPQTAADKRILLDRLPKLLQGYGKTFAKNPKSYSCAVVVVCDLDSKCLKKFLQELNSVLNGISPKPITRFCLAIEEGEAWLLGDIPAVKRAYPKARKTVLDKYTNDSICGTWELLADAIFAGGQSVLRDKGYPAIGLEKAEWATRITPHMNIDSNSSPSFNYFLKKICELIK